MAPFAFVKLHDGNTSFQKYLVYKKNETISLVC